MGFQVYHVGLEVSQAFYYAEKDCYERVFPDGNQEKWQDKKKKKNWKHGVSRNGCNNSLIMFV